jgi:thiol:disulfide interchange protein
MLSIGMTTAGRQFFFSALALLALAVTPLFARQGGPKTQPIHFIENKWNAALQTAGAEHKLIFADAYAVWCAPCKQLQQTTFTDTAVAAYFNRHFVNVSLDAEKGEGIAFASRWALQVYPTLYFFDEQGRLLASHEGYLDAGALLAMAKKIRVLAK